METRFRDLPLGTFFAFEDGHKGQRTAFRKWRHAAPQACKAFPELEHEHVIGNMGWRVTPINVPLCNCGIMGYFAFLAEHTTNCQLRKFRETA